MDHGAEAAAAHGLKRSDRWPEVERAYREAHPTCAACSSAAVQVHHVIPFHFAILLGRPDLELDPRNLIALCEKERGDDAEDHHLLLGHLDDFESWNANVRQSVKVFAADTAEQIRASGAWQFAAEHKPKTWADMTDQDKADLRALMDALYPLAGETTVAETTPAAATEKKPKTPAQLAAIELQKQRAAAKKAGGLPPVGKAAPAGIGPHRCNMGHACNCATGEDRHGCSRDSLKDGSHA